MPRQTKVKARKGSNGTGSTVTLYFDAADPAERKALAAARLLATKHGRRKQAIVALLEAVYTHYEATGELMSASAISSALIGQGASPGRDPTGFAMINAGAEKALLSAASRPESRTQRKRQRAGGVEITRSAAKGSSETVAKNFLNSMKGLASGFFD